jgi:hypothetical protein
VILHNATLNDLDHLSHDTAPQQSTLRVAEHLLRTADDLHLADLNHHADTALRILLDAAALLPEVLLSSHRHHEAWTLALSPHRMLMTPGAIGKIIILLTLITRMLADLVHHKLPLPIHPLRHH